MTTAADDRAVEDAFEAYLAGRPVLGEGAALASFGEAVRGTATRPGRPNAALAELLATGLLADQPIPSARTAPSAGTPPRGASRIRNRRRVAMILPALLAKLLSAGAVAQAATGAGVVLVVVTGAGAAGVLPDPLQSTVAAAVGTVTPFELPDGEETGPVQDPTAEDPTVEEPVADEPPADEDVAGEVPAEEAAFDPEVWEQGPDTYPSFGAWVSEGAHNKAALEAAAALRGDEPFRFGQLVRTWAQDKHVDIADVEVDGVGVEELLEPTPTTAPEVATQSPAPAPATATQHGGGRGNAGTAGNGAANGNGNGNGKGNAGGGNGRN